VEGWARTWAMAPTARLATTRRNSSHDEGGLLEFGGYRCAEGEMTQREVGWAGRIEGAVRLYFSLCVTWFFALRFSCLFGGAPACIL